MRYHGGKYRLAPWIIRHFPPHRCYVEPFGGAAGVLIQKPRSYAEVYNDLDGDIVNVFRVLRDEGQCRLLVEALQLTPYARDEFNGAYEPADDPIERARRTFIRAEMGFGSAGATKGSTGFRIDTRRKYGTAPQLWERLPDGLAAFCERLQGVMIENRPAADVIAQHAAPDALLYLDPPYVHSTRVGGGEAVRNYAHEMTDTEHAALLQQVRALDAMVVLSGYETDLYRDLLPGWTVNRTNARISAARGTDIRVECVWINPACMAALDAGGLIDWKV
ncbi:DNA adenine methylase [Burkholderia gladioli]|uniref:DNA adenine methylase n=1 Tax=Burkholderia gladioli TaxID=28095 RepID=UPI0016413144|nr:DNA adenine methylase [Burkholderia gladioli]